MSASDLCISCGLCCDGGVTDYLPLEPEEAESARRVGLPVVTDHRGVYVLMACPAHAARCTVYEGRPAPCRSYRCLTLQRLEAGELTAERASQIVREAKASRARLDALLPPGRGSVSRRAEVAIAGAVATPEARRASAAPLLELAAFEQFITRHEVPHT